MQEYLPSINTVSKTPKEDNLKALQNTWDQAFERMHSVTSKERMNLISNITALKDFAFLKNYLESHRSELKPEEKHFIEMSIRVKQYADSLKISPSEITGNGNNESISDVEYETFISKNLVSAKILELIAKKIISKKILSPRELAIYSEKSSEIENLIKSNLINN